MRGSRHPALTALVATALLACSGTDQREEGAAATPERAALKEFGIKICANVNLGGPCKEFTHNDTNLDLSDLNQVSYPDGTKMAGRVRSFTTTRGPVWIALFEKPRFEGQAAYAGWGQSAYMNLTNLQHPGGSVNFSDKAQSMVIFVRSEPLESLTSKRVTIVARGRTEGTFSEKKMYVCADGLKASPSDGWPLIANRDRVGEVGSSWGSWETFDMYTVGYGVPKSMPNPFFALRASWGGGYSDNRTVAQKFIVAEWNAGSEAPLYANRDEIGPWEVFRLAPTKSGGNWQQASFYSITKNTNPYQARDLNQPNEASGTPLASRPPSSVSLNQTDRFLIQDVTTTQQGQPLLIHPYTADPSAHFFNGRMYVYPSHDTDEWVGTFRMVDYHVFSMKTPTSQVIDHGAVLTKGQDAASWAKERMWAPDATYANGKYYLFFPARAYDNQNHIGVAVSDKPEGPFTKVAGASASGYIEGAISIDPGVLHTDTDEFYLYTGGINDGQLQCFDPVWGFDQRGNEKVMSWTWRGGADGECSGRALKRTGPVVAKLNSDMASLAEAPQPVVLYWNDETGNHVIDDEDQDFKNQRRYFEAPFVLNVRGMYYLTYSTGYTGNLYVASAASPYGDPILDNQGQPMKDENGHALRGFRVMEQGNILGPRCGWTTHQSVVHTTGAEWGDKWYLFYHDSQLAPDAPPLGECGPSPDDGLMDKRTIMFKEIQFPPAW